ncbi:hypothetical protein Tco_0367697 [Tanacetum coccineum]
MDLLASHTTGGHLQNLKEKDQPSATSENGNKDVVYQLEPIIKQNLNSNLNFVSEAGIFATDNLQTALASGTLTVENPEDSQLVNKQSSVYIDVYQRVKEALFHEDTSLECSFSHEAEKSKEATNDCIQEIVKIHDIPVEPPAHAVTTVNYSFADQVQPSSCYQDKDTSQQPLIPLSSNPETSSDECEQDQCHKECQGFKNTIKTNKERNQKDKEKVSCDWSVKASNPNNHVVSVGRKSKGAILGSLNKKLEDHAYDDFMHDMREYEKETDNP